MSLKVGSAAVVQVQRDLILHSFKKIVTVTYWVAFYADVKEMSVKIGFLFIK